FVARKSEPRKNFVFIKRVIADEIVRCQRIRNRFVLLMIPTEEEKNLRLKRVAFAVLIKAREKGIFLKHFEQQTRVKHRFEQTRQRRFADADYAFDGNIHMLLVHRCSRTIRIQIAIAATNAPPDKKLAAQKPYSYTTRARQTNPPRVPGKT